MNKLTLLELCDYQIERFTKLKEEILRGDEWLSSREAVSLTGWTARQLRTRADSNKLVTRRMANGDREYLRSSLLERVRSENGDFKIVTLENAPMGT